MLVVITVLLISMQFSNGGTTFENTIMATPTINYVAFSLPINASVSSYQKVSIYIDVSGLTNYTAAIVTADLYIVDLVTLAESYIEQVTLDYNGSTGNFVGEFIVYPTWPQGMLYVPNVEVFTDMSYFFSSPYDYDAPSLIVPTLQLDLDPPSLVSISASQPNGTMLYVNDTITFTLTANDALSGFNSGVIQLYYDDGGAGTQIYSLNYVFTEIGQLSYTGTANYTITPYSLAGRYYIGVVELYDFAGNAAFYYDGVNLSYSFSFYVNGTPADNIPPSLQGLGFFDSEAVPGGTLEAWVAASDNEGVDSIYAELYAVPSSGQNADLISTATFTPGVKNANVTLTFYLYALNSTSPYDYVFINYILLTDINYNSVPLYDGFDFTSPRIPIGTGSAAPMLSNVGAEKEFVAPGENATFWIEFNNTGSGSLDNSTYIEALIIENRGNANYSEYLSPYQNGSRYYFNYFVEPTTPIDTIIYISEISVFYSAGVITFLNGIDFWSPMVIVEVPTPPPVNESIEIFVAPATIDTFVNETVQVNVTIKSNFMHDMPNVTFVLTELSSNTTLFRYTFYLPANSTFNIMANVTFYNSGTFTVVGTLFDDIGTPWSYAIVANVRERPTSTTGTSSNTTNSTTALTSSQPITTNNITSSNTTESTIESSPEISGLFAPGYTFFIAMMSFGTIVLLRKKAKWVL